MLENAFESAARYDVVGDILDGIATIYRDWQRELRAESAEGPPGLKDVLAPWQQRCGESLALLERVAAAARHAAA